MPHQDLFLARRGELRPVTADRCGQIEVATVGEDQRAQCRHRLRDRPDVGDRVPLPRHRAVRVGEPTPDVHHRFAVHEDRNRGTDVSAVQQSGQRTRHRGEQVVARALDVGHVLY
jgi:hypothetical protein